MSPSFLNACILDLPQFASTLSRVSIKDNAVSFTLTQNIVPIEEKNFKGIFYDKKHKISVHMILSISTVRHQ